MPRLSRTATNSSRTVHVEFTSSLRHVHELVRVAAWPYLPTDTVMCTSRIDGTSSSRLVYALHEQFAHGMSRSRRVHEQFTNSLRVLRDSGARVGAGVYIGLDTARHSRDRQRRDNLYHIDNMPKTKQTRGRAKQRRPEADRPEAEMAEIAERDHSSQSSISCRYPGDTAGST